MSQKKAKVKRLNDLTLDEIIFKMRKLEEHWANQRSKLDKSSTDFKSLFCWGKLLERRMYYEKHNHKNTRQKQ